MCGFAGVVGRQGDQVSAALAERMADFLAHRGPDDRGSYASGPVAFGFRRLSIFDLSSAGHQPFLSADGQVALVFNGAIYNFPELRDELRGLGHEFHSTGDTEVLLAAYLQWGMACLPRLNGMWAFLIHDRRTGMVHGSRDRFGIKPLYHVQDGDRRFFASEIKALHTVAPASREVAWARVARFLAAGRLESIDADGGTFFAAVEEVPAGTWFSLAPDGAFAQGSYWQIPDEEEDADDPTAAFSDLFLNAVDLRMRSDVPVGVALSGGLDSAAIISAMARRRGSIPRVELAPLHAFTYHSPGHDESVFVAATLDQTGASAHSVELSPASWWSELPRVLYHHDEPVHSASASVGYEIFRAARAAGVKVLLGGQGADETLAGYPSYFPESWHDLLGRGEWSTCLREVSDFAEGHRQERRRLIVAATLRSVLRMAGRIGLYRAAMAGRRAKRLLPFKGLLSGDLASMMPPALEPATFGLHAALHHDTTRSPLPLYLRIEDRNSMAHAVEGRLPFMDHRLVELAFRLANRWKVRGRWNKYILRQATAGLIPDVVGTRIDKMGFPTPISGWLAGELRGPVQELLTSHECRSRGILAPTAVEDVLNRHAAGEHSLSSVVFNLAQTELWLDALGSGGTGRAVLQDGDFAGSPSKSQGGTEGISVRTA